MDKIIVENVNHPGKSERVDAEKYRAMREAMLTVLTAQAEPVDYTTLKQRVKPSLPQQLFPGGATSGWWIKTVQLDLEAKGKLARTTDKPLRFFLKGAGQTA
ncbi:hypothetical protein PZ897_10365 [Hoeflea sp. YIM 152468]|uniref:DUF6958 family protein n=1 Tax=Hoeflea sp. YIM 152468 TaxID=3031759 RepID=UPI0023DC3940|nr:hypothetical protein [Hoeflea sp. YIM 152468]MDF1608579.1 hypothetical protein [Hoeflea sp. YIM 152468]